MENCSTSKQKKMTIEIDAELHTRFKTYAAKHNIPMSTLIKRLMAALLKKDNQ